jgi:hypothetical protein
MKKNYQIILTFFLLNGIMILYCFFLKELPIPQSLFLGWPYVFYQHFKLPTSISANHGWNINNLIIDEALYLTMSIAVYFIFNAIRKQ